MDTSRRTPKVTRAPGATDFARLLAFGLDTLEETFNHKISDWVEDVLDKAKSEAAAGGDRGKAVTACAIGDEVFLVAGHGGQGGVKWFLTNDDFLIRMRSPDAEWSVSVRYLAAGLWEHGADALRLRVKAFLGAIGTPVLGRSESVKRFDFAFDFHAPKFTAEMTWSLVGRFVAPAKSKIRPVGTSARLETVSIGSKRAVEIQVYDKGLEIREASGKEWMREMWAKTGHDVPEGEKVRDVWRLECRFAKEWLRDRGINTYSQAMNARCELIAEALTGHRLCVPSDDSNRRRWPMHPLWCLAMAKAGSPFMAPLGRRFTLRRDQMAAMVKAQAAGCLRAAAVLETEDFNAGDAERLAVDVKARLAKLGDDDQGTERLRERYLFHGEAR
jgi:hypothetical protein